ncbi:CBS domain-containing protein [Sphingomicrobium marinum]|uniref:CBS domain-containing protein n=1 Tax=Sphingomicrobium marinum TaxID=1227950 RepID=UPI00223EAB51|nr:CBS domain-containing protein [Sphingomicrobium marinum]
MQIDQIMTKDIKTVSPKASVKEAASFMLSEDTGFVPVCDGEKLVGTITDRDIAVRGVAEGKDGNCCVEELMSSSPECCSVNDTIEQAAQKMKECQVRRLPVIGENQELVGVVSLGDIARESGTNADEMALQGVSARGDLHKQS